MIWLAIFLLYIIIVVRVKFNPIVHIREEDVIQAEIYYISKYQSNQSTKGYNLTTSDMNLIRGYLKGNGFI